jgi:hypothetical protein
MEKEFYEDGEVWIEGVNRNNDLKVIIEAQLHDVYSTNFKSQTVNSSKLRPDSNPWIKPPY